MIYYSYLLLTYCKFLILFLLFKLHNYTVLQPCFSFLINLFFFAFPAYFSVSFGLNHVPSSKQKEQNNVGNSLNINRRTMSAIQSISTEERYIFTLKQCLKSVQSYQQTLEIFLHFVQSYKKRQQNNLYISFKVINKDSITVFPSFSKL